jgi:hypothetical protein
MMSFLQIRDLIKGLKDSKITIECPKGTEDLVDFLQGKMS